MTWLAQHCRPCTLILKSLGLYPWQHLPQLAGYKITVILVGYNEYIIIVANQLRIKADLFF